MANLSSFSNVVDTEAVIPGVGGHSGKYLSTDGSTMSWSAIVQGVTTYATADDLPLTGVDEGTMAYVSGNTRVYFWNGSGWYSLALVNTAPTITTGADAAYELAIDGTATVITLEASDPEGLPLTWSYSVTSGSIGNTATVSQSANVFTITPSTNEADAGEFSLTFTASDGINTATNTAAFTLTFVTIVENSKYTSALITGAAAGTNRSFSDSSTNNHAISISNQTQSSTFSPYRSGGYSYSSDGSTGQMYAQGLNVGTGAFTVECWYYYSVAENNSTLRPIFQVDYGYSTTGFGIRRRYGYIYALRGNTEVANIVEADYVNQWIHLAVVCNSSNQATFYINGTAVATNEELNFTLNARQDLDISILSYVNPITWNNDFYCPEGDYVRDFRIVKSAVYTADFTPPTGPLEAITDTEFLTCHLPYVKDGSSNDHSITVNGNVSAKPFGPYDYNGYDPATHGGSAYFDGVNDYLQTQVNAIGTSDFTLEFWAYYTADEVAEDGIFRLGTSYGAGEGLWLARYDTIYHRIAGATAGALALNANSSGHLPIGSWFHIAISRSSGTTTLYYNGTAVRTVADSFDYQSTYLRIGSYSGDSKEMQGYVSDFRIVIGTAVYTADFTPPTEALTAISGTEFLLSGTDSGVVDKTQRHELVLGDNAKGSTTETKYGASMYFRALSDYIKIPDSEHLNMGTGDFTVEFWYKHAATYGDYPSIISGKTWTGGGVGIRYDNSTTPNKFAFFWNGVGDPWLTSSSTFNTTDWHHVALTRSGNNFTLWVNGTSQATGSNSGSIDWAFGGDCKIGWGEWDGADGYVNAYIEDLRITKGLARYTSSFTPPTASLEG